MHEGPLERHLVLSSVESDNSKIFNPKPVKVLASAMAIPHPEKLKAGVKGRNNRCKGRGGEDSYFYKYGQYVAHNCTSISREMEATFIM